MQECVLPPLDFNRIKFPILFVATESEVNCSSSVSRNVGLDLITLLHVIVAIEVIEILQNAFIEKAFST
jgi:hypothetical protein